MYSQLTLVSKKQEFSKIGNKVFIPTGVQTNKNHLISQIKPSLTFPSRVYVIFAFSTLLDNLMPRSNQMIFTGLIKSIYVNGIQSPQ
jgi:hypothetical protein